MKLNGFRCKSCGANIKIKDGDKIVTCPYCNNTYSVDEEKNSNESDKKRAGAQPSVVWNAQLIVVLIVIPIIFFTLIAIIAGVMGAKRKSTNSNTYSQIENSQEKLQMEQEKNSIKNEAEKRNLETEAFKFNMHYYSGTSFGGSVWNQLDSVITSNKTNKERAITVKYQETQTTSPEEILKIKKQLKQFNKYEVILDYDNDGFVNVITIEDLK